MTQIVVTLEKDADTALLRRMIENMKGVIKASLRETKKIKDTQTDEWINKMNTLSDLVDPSIVDMSDERTRYLMSK